MIHGKLIEEHIEDFRVTLEENNIPKEKRGIMAQLLGSQVALLEERTVTGEVAGYDKFLFKLVERGYPAVIGLDIFGVQMMEGPTGMIFALWRSYSGDDNTPTGVKKSNGVIMIVADGTAFATQNTAIVGGTSGAKGNVVYAEGNKLLIKVTSGTFVDGEEVDDAATFSAAVTTISLVTDNVQGYKQVFTDYAAFSTVYAGEIASADIKQISINIEKLTVTAETKKLKAKYSEEMRQDLQKLHKKDAAEIFSGIASQEFALELNQDMLAQMKVSAATGGIVPWDYSLATGLSQKQKIESLLATLSRESGNVARTSMMGFANWIVTDVETFGTLDIFGFIDRSMLPNKILDPTLNAFMGVLVGRWRVFVDLFEDDNVIYLGYKDMSGRPEAEWKAPFYFCPYIPAESLEVRDPNSGQPNMIIMTRYAIQENPYGAYNFLRKINVLNLPN
jgi:hypothetical protein